MFLIGTVTVQVLPSNYAGPKAIVLILFSSPLIIVSIHRTKHNRRGYAAGDEVTFPKIPVKY